MRRCPPYPPEIQALIDRDAEAMSYEELCEAAHLLGNFANPLLLQVGMVQLHKREIEIARQQDAAA